MKYMLLIHGEETCWTEAEREACMIESMGVCQQLAAQGKFLDASPLQSVTEAVTVRVRDGRTIVTDGPFAETTEQLGGYYILDLANLDEAIAVACRLPPVSKGTIEIRPLDHLDGLPEDRPSSAVAGDGSLRPFLLLCYDDERAWEKAGTESLHAARDVAAGRCRELAATGRYVSASPLRPASTATCVRVRDGRRSITDGPYAETREVLGGYYLILAESRDAAARFAAGHPGAPVGSVEVRPLFDLSVLQSRD